MNDGRRPGAANEGSQRGDTEARVVTRRREGRRSLPHRLHGRIAKRERWLRAGRECAWTERRSLRQRECAVGLVGCCCCCCCCWWCWVCCCWVCCCWGLLLLGSAAGSLLLLLLLLLLLPPPPPPPPPLLPLPRPCRAAKEKEKVGFGCRIV